MTKNQEAVEISAPNQEIAKAAANTKLDMTTAQKMVLKYSSSLVNDKRAQQFFAQFMLLQRNNPKLASVDPQSLLTAVMACVHLDLMPNTPEQYAFIIPYGNQAQFQVGYKGLVELAFRDGGISSIAAELVFDGDDFDVMLGTERGLRHRPNYEIDRTDYSKVTHAYATAILKDGSSVFEVLTRKELDKVRATSKATTGDTPWAKWPESMAKKTAVKRLTKLLPGSTEDNRLKIAAEIDSLAEVGRLNIINGEIVGEASNEVPDHVKEAIASATTREELSDLLQQLPVKDRKNAASLVEARLKEL